MNQAVTVLVVDDPAIVDVVRDFLDDFGQKSGLDFNVIQTFNEDALLPQMAIVDPWWVKDNPSIGQPAIHAVRRLHLPVVISTLDELNLGEAEGLRFLPKPMFDLALLESFVREFLGFPPKRLLAA